MYERLQCPGGSLSGDPVPSIEGWVLLLGGLPAVTSTTDIRNLLVSYSAEDAEYFGNVKEVRLSTGSDGNCGDWALVELDSEEGFRRAIAELNGLSLNAAFGTEGEAAILRVAPAFVREEEELNQEDEPSEPARQPGMKRGRDNDDADEERGDTVRIRDDE